MKKFSNVEKIHLAMAVWLAEDLYDHNPDPLHISATGLLKSTKQIVLASRVPVAPPNTPIAELKLEDISSRVASAMGTALHNGIEHAWRNNFAQCMLDLGYPPGLIKRVKINPKPEELTEDTIAVYLEKRVEKKLGPFTISGQYDIIIDGKLGDYKSTGVYGYMKGNNDDKYCKQGSIYRWLNPTLITDDWMDIHFIFTDWSKLRAKVEAKKGYPVSRVLAHPVQLISVIEIETWMKQKLQTIHDNKDKKQQDMPPCNKEELWMRDSIFKYFKNPAKTARATKNYDNIHDANLHLAKDGNVGIVKEVHGAVKACEYCKAYEICLQKDLYLENGTLVIGG